MHEPTIDPRVAPLGVSCPPRVAPGGRGSVPGRALVGGRLRAAVLLSFVVLLSGGACGSDGPNEQAAPEAAFRAFRSALARGDTESVWRFLGPQTRAALEARAAGLPESGRSPARLLVAAWVADESEIDTVERLEYSEEAAKLRVRTALGREFELTLFRSDEGWRLELPLPAATPEEPGD